jgi:hypothetical protein
MEETNACYRRDKKGSELPSGELRSLAIVEHLEPRRALAGEPPPGVLMANHRVTDRPATRVGVNQDRATQVLAAALTLGQGSEIHSRLKES